VLERAEDAQSHEQYGDQHVEDQPDHAPRVAVRDAGEEVRPRERPGVGVGDVDFHLRNDDEYRGREGGPAVLGKHVAEAGEVHLRRLERLVERYLGLQREKGEEGAAEDLQHSRNDPPRTRHQHRCPPAHAVTPRLFGQEAQEVDLLADLHDEREGDGRRGAEHQPVEMAVSGALPGEPGELAEDGGVLERDRHERAGEQHEPDGLRPQLQPRDQGDAVRDERDDHERRQQIAQHDRQPEIKLQGERHDGRLEREEDEREARVDQRRDGRAEVAEARAAREQVHVEAVLRRVVADRQAGEEGDQSDRENRPEGVGESVVQRDRAADRLQREERYRAERGVRDPELGPAPEAARRVAQRIVLERLVRDPGVVVAPYAKDLLCCRGQRLLPVLLPPPRAFSCKKRTGAGSPVPGGCDGARASCWCSGPRICMSGVHEAAHVQYVN
jgi:hypothetical protein